MGRDRRRAPKELDWKKLPKTLRVAIDSSPLEDAGRRARYRGVRKDLFDLPWASAITNLAP